MRARDETDASGRAESERNMHTTIAIKTQRLSCHATCVRWWLSTSAGEQISKRKKQACGLHGQQKRNTNRITASNPHRGSVVCSPRLTSHATLSLCRLCVHCWAALCHHLSPPACVCAVSFRKRSERAAGRASVRAQAREPVSATLPCAVAVRLCARLASGERGYAEHGDENATEREHERAGLGHPPGGVKAHRDGERAREEKG